MNILFSLCTCRFKSRACISGGMSVILSFVLVSLVDRVPGTNSTAHLWLALVFSIFFYAVQIIIYCDIKSKSIAARHHLLLTCFLHVVTVLWCLLGYLCVCTDSHMLPSWKLQEHDGWLFHRVDEVSCLMRFFLSDTRRAWSWNWY